MSKQVDYGTEFISHLRSISSQSHFVYADLQRIKAMSRDQLSDCLKSTCPAFSEFVLSNPPKEAAVLYAERSRELAASNKGLEISGAADGAFSLLQAIIYLFSAAE